MSRRRSRPDVPAVDVDDAAAPATTRPGRRKSLIVAFVLSTIVLAFFLIQQVQQGPFNPFTHWARPAAVEHPNFTLHPEDHAFRNATSQTFHFRVSRGARRADGVLKDVYLINGAYPGPTIETRPGDRLIISVENALEEGEGLSLHFHGLSMRDANHFDGAVGITQSPIPSGAAFTYNFTIDPDQHGTFWYHSHFAEQRADGLYGGLIVHKPESEAAIEDLASESLLLIGDWYHRTAVQALQYYMHPGAFGLETVPDSIVVNGQGAYRCSDAVPARPVDCKVVNKSSMQSLDFDASRRNVLRVVNVGAYAGFEMSVRGALLTPLTQDGGHSIKGTSSKTVGFLHPGERMDLLLEQNRVATLETDLIVTLDEKPFKYDNLALTPTHSFPVRWHGQAMEPSKSDPATFERFDIQDVTAAHDQSEVLPQSADQMIVLYTLTQKLAHLENEPHGFINNTAWLPQTPSLVDLPREQFNRNQLVPHIPFKESSFLWIDIVLNNLDEDSHPFHLHGNDFWVISKYSSDLNWGSYNPYEDATPPAGDYDLVGAPKRDTVYVPRRGYAVLRFRADNPGLWMFHCHVLWHQASGMAMAFEVK